MGLRTFFSRHQQRDASGTELRNFIAQSLTEIAQGIRAANDTITQQALTKEPNFFLKHGGDPSSGTGIEFDVAVTTRREKEGSGSASIKIQVVQADLGAKGSYLRESVARIKFLIHVKNWTG
jgi:hypothetical protein